MFVKLTKSNNYQYVQIVKSYRENGSIKHKVMLNLGRLDQIEQNPSIRRLAARLAGISKAKDLINLNTASEAEVVNYGYIVYKKLFEQFGLSEILTAVKAGRKIKFNLNDACFLMVIAHLLEPRSKLSTFLGQGRYAKLPFIDLNSLYRSLDILAANKECLEEKLFNQGVNLFNRQVDMVFYDVTTFSFESVKRDSLRDFGFSKDCKFNEVQVVLGLLIDTEGRPIGYDLFPGNTFEGKTLDIALEKLEKRFNVRKVIIVADKGINSKLNLKKITDKGYSYIFASRLKALGKKVREEILKGDYTELNETNEKLSYKVIDWANKFRADGKDYNLAEKLFITYSQKRAAKDRTDRDRLIEKAKELLANETRIRTSNKRGGKKYLKNVSSTNWILDEEAIKKDEAFDGYYGITTNEKELRVEEVLEAYHTLWKIEEAFRVMKSNLEVRPIFHWTETRIKGHFVVCFLAFLMERTLEFKLKELKAEASVEKIKEAINSLNLAELEMGGQKYYIKTKPTQLANKILRKLRISPPKNVTLAEEFSL